MARQRQSYWVILFLCSLITPVTFFLFSYYLLQGSRPPNSRCRNPSGETAPVSKTTLICVGAPVWKKKKISRSQNLSSLGEMPLKHANAETSPDPWGQGWKDKGWTKPGLREVHLSFPFSSVLWWDHLRSGTFQKLLCCTHSPGVCEA